MVTGNNSTVATISSCGYSENDYQNSMSNLKPQSCIPFLLLSNSCCFQLFSAVFLAVIFLLLFSCCYFLLFSCFGNTVRFDVNVVKSVVNMIMSVCAVSNDCDINVL